MHRPSIRWIVTGLGIPAGIIAATAVPAAASNDTAVALRHEPDAASLGKPPMPCVAVRAGAFPVGSGFCPDTPGALDWHTIAAALNDDVAASITWEETHRPITVELLTPTDRSTHAATIGLDVTFSDRIADQLATGDPPHLVVWITMATPGDAQSAADISGIAGCPAAPGSADDFVPDSRRMPRC